MMAKMEKLSLVDESEMEKMDSRNTKKHYLATDSICSDCGCINNTYYNEECQICKECKGEIFVTGKIGVQLRLLLDYKTIELRELCDANGINTSYRINMILEILKLLNQKEKKKSGKGCIFDFDKRVTENLIRIMIKRKQKKNWYTKEIDVNVKAETLQKLAKIKVLEDDDDNLVTLSKIEVLEDDDII